MKNYRLTYKKLNSYGELVILFTTIIQAKSMRGAMRIAKNLEPFQFVSMSIISLESEFNLKLDQIEFNY